MAHFTNRAGYRNTRIAFHHDTQASHVHRRDPPDGVMGDTPSAAPNAASATQIEPTPVASLLDVLGGHASTVQLEQSAETLLAGYGGMAVSNDGDVLWADPSEGNVKWFDSSGRLLRTLGRKGRGPGEFQFPSSPHFGPDGLIHVVDVGQGGVISRFNSRGEFVDSTSPPSVGSIGSLTVLPGQRYLVTAVSMEPDKRDVLHLLDENGSTLRSMLPIRDATPEGQPEHPIWNTLRGFLLAADTQTAYVTAVLSDSLWVVDVESGDYTAHHVAIPGRTPVALPAEGNPRDLMGLMQWANGLYLALRPSLSNQRIVLTYTKGNSDSFGSQEAVQVIGDLRGTWWYVADGTMVTAGNGDRMVAITGMADAVKVMHLVHD